MAEINIERKKKSSWGWIILLLALAIIAWLVYKYVFASETDPTYTADPTSSLLIPAARMLLVA